MLVNLLRLDPESVLAVDFEPWSGFGDQSSLATLMDWVAQHHDHVDNPEELYCV